MKKNKSEFRQKTNKRLSILKLENNGFLKKDSRMPSINELPDISEQLNDYEKNNKLNSDSKVELKTISPRLTPSFEKKIFRSNEIHLSHESKTSQIKVIARFRPTNKFETELSKKEAGFNCVEYISKNTVAIQSTLIPKTQFTFDAVFDSGTLQKDFYKEVIEETINDVLSGYNGTVFTYGQSGSGKTHTMFGPDILDEESKGIIPRSVDQIFDYINNAKDQTEYQLNFSILEIYKENIYDLLNTDTKTSDLKIKEDPKKGIYVDNLTSVSVEEKEEFFAILEAAQDNRSIAETRLNKSSSRSHVVFMLHIKQKFVDDTEKIGTLNLVDLAGSEKIAKTGAVGETLEEAKKINQSLSCLGNVINCLTGSNKDFVPYRESKLTRLLKDSLGGNFKTTLIVTCSPHSYNAEDSISTLNFAKRAKNVKNKVKINIKRSPEELEKIIAELQAQLKMKNAEITKFMTSNFTTKESSKNSYNEISLSVPDNAINTPVAQEIYYNDQSLEINKLKEEVESLKNENKLLNEEIEKYKRIFNMEVYLEKLENSAKITLKNLEDNLMKYKFQSENHFVEENRFLKEKIKEKDEKNYESLIYNCKNELNIDLRSIQDTNFTNKFQDFIQKATKIQNSDYLFKSYEAIFNYSKYSCVFPSIESLDPNLFRKEIHHSHLSKEYFELKDRYLKIFSITFFKDKMLNDLLSKLTLDLKNFDLNQAFIKENSSHLLNLSNHLHDYLSILNELKQINSQCRKRSLFDRNETFQKEPEYQRTKFIRNVTRKFSKKVTSMNVLGRLIFNKIDDKIDMKENDNSEDVIDTNQKLSFINPKDDDNKNIVIVEEENENEHKNLELINSINFLRKLSKKATKKTNSLTNVNKSNEHTLVKNQSDNDQTILELKSLRKENNLNSNYINDLIRESSEMQKKIHNYDKIIFEYEMIIKEGHLNELNNTKKLFEMLKSSYNDDIYTYKSIIEELGTLIDDILLNQKQLFSNQPLIQFYENSKENILGKRKYCFQNISSFTQGFINDGGTASKKLDYIKINMSQEGIDEINIELGSGIQQKIKSKCPLKNNLYIEPRGDQNCEIWIPE